MRIYLVGFMSAGKTTIGYQLSRLLCMPFMDIDKQIALEEGAAVTEIFENFGEAHFRKKEQAVLNATYKIPQLIVASGGGTPCFFDNMEQMKKAGFTFYLKLPIETIVHRLIKTNKERPLVSGKSPEELRTTVQKLFKEREYFYNQAQYAVDASNRNAIHYISRILSGHMY